MKKLLTLLLTLLLGILSLFGCGQSTDQPEESAEVEEIVSTFASDIIVDEENKTLSQRVNITVYPEDATYKDLNLSIKFSNPSPYIDGEDTEVENYISAVFENEDTILITLLQPYGAYAKNRSPVVRVESRNGVSLEIPITYKGLATGINYTCESSYISRLNSRNNAWLLIPSEEPIKFIINSEKNIFNDAILSLTYDVKAYGSYTYYEEMCQYMVPGYVPEEHEINLSGKSIKDGYSNIAKCFDISLDENYISVQPKCAFDKYYWQSGEYEGATLSVSDDLYVEIIIIDENSGLSLSIPFFIDEGVSAIESDSTEVVF